MRVINPNRKSKTKKGMGKDTKAFAFIIYVAFKNVALCDKFAP